MIIQLPFFEAGYKFREKEVLFVFAWPKKRRGKKCLREKCMNKPGKGDERRKKTCFFGRRGKMAKKKSNVQILRYSLRLRLRVGSNQIYLLSLAMY